jgi:hypothetical protein
MGAILAKPKNRLMPKSVARPGGGVGPLGACRVPMLGYDSSARYSPAVGFPCQGPATGFSLLVRGLDLMDGARLKECFQIFGAVSHTSTDANVAQRISSFGSPNS